MKFFSKRMMGVVLAALLAVFAFTGALAENETAYGADAVKEGETYTLEQMLTYALQDEYRAQAAYKALAEKFGAVRSFASALKAESSHIAKLTALMKAHGIAVPADDAQAAALPATAEEAIQTGIALEQKNIAMYAAFLKQDGLADDVKAAFEQLQKASQNHLSAFSRNTAQTASGTQRSGQADATAGATANGRGMGRRGMQQNQNGSQQNSDQQNQNSGQQSQGGSQNPNGWQDRGGMNRGFGNMQDMRPGMGRMGGPNGPYHQNGQVNQNGQNNQTCPNCPNCPDCLNCPNCSMSGTGGNVPQKP